MIPRGQQRFQQDGKARMGACTPSTLLIIWLPSLRGQASSVRPSVQGATGENISTRRRGEKRRMYSVYPPCEVAASSRARFIAVILYCSRTAVLAAHSLYHTWYEQKRHISSTLYVAEYPCRKRLFYITPEQLRVEPGRGP